MAAYFFPKRTNRLVFIMQKQFVLCEVENIFLITVSVIFMLRSCDGFNNYEPE